jgi:hypothetical protein
VKGIMMEFAVTITQTIYHTVVIDADNADEIRQFGVSDVYDLIADGDVSAFEDPYICHIYNNETHEEWKVN